MYSTQSHLPIEDIRDDLIYLKDGSVNLVLVTSAVNFGLLFETEQNGIIQNFASTLNSLSFPIQILILSKRLNISSYLKTIDLALANIQNPLLKNLSLRYRSFVESLIKDNEVLDKQFYISIPISPYELGLIKKGLPDRGKKAMTILKPRSDHMTKQLIRLGLKSRRLTTVELIKLFFETYNRPAEEAVVAVPPSIAPPQPISTQPMPVQSLPQSPPPVLPSYSPRFAGEAGPPLPTPVTQTPPPAQFVQPRAISPLPPSPVQNSPYFVVEEVPDDHHNQYS